MKCRQNRRNVPLAQIVTVTAQARRSLATDGAAIRARREELAWPLKKLSAETRKLDDEGEGVGTRTIIRAENGGPIELRSVRLIAAALNVSPTWLVQGHRAAVSAPTLRYIDPHV